MTQTLTKSTSAPTDLSWRPDLRSPLVLALALMLGVQLLLALGLALRQPGLEAPASHTPLLAFEPAQVARIRIEGSGDTGQVTLERQGKDKWVIGDLGDFPAAGARPEQLLQHLAALKRPLPMATSEEARKRFKVADEGFGRRLTLEDGSGKVLANLLIGDSPGYKRVFARPAGDPGVYELNLAVSDVSSRRDDWLDTGLLHLEQDKISRIAGRDWAVAKSGDGWRFEGNDQKVDQAAVEEALVHLANLSYRGVLGTQDDPAYQQQSPKLELTIGLADGTQRQYRVSQAEKSEDFVLKEADRPYYFKLSKYDLEGLLELGVDQLKVKPKVEEPPKAADGPPAENQPKPAEEPKAETGTAPGDPSPAALRQEPEPAAAPAEPAQAPGS